MNYASQIDSCGGNIRPRSHDGFRPKLEYNSECVGQERNQKIGDIKELMLAKSGKVADVVIGVGGFLGMGEHDVAVNFDRLKWSDGAATTGSGQPASQSKNTKQNYPDHAVLNATKDQLKSMPNFDYSK